MLARRVLWLTLLICACASAAVAQGLRAEFISPVDTDARIDRCTEPHFTCFDSNAPRRGELLLYMVGLADTPRVSQLLLRQAAGNGFHAISLSYVNTASPRDICRPTRDSTCYERVRMEVIDGVDRSPYVDVNRVNSIENRLEKLLRLLHERYPAEGWNEYVAEDPFAWSRFVVAGHSLGAGMAAKLAKQHRVAQVVMLGGPSDWMPWAKQPAPWLYAPSATPEHEYYGLVHEEDATVIYLSVWSALGLSRYGPPRNVDAVPLGSVRGPQLLTRLRPADGGSPHTAVALDAHVPRDDQGNPAYAPIWRFMMTSRFREGDLDGSGCIDQADLGLMLASFGRAADADLDGDGDTDQADLGQLLAHFGGGCR